MEMQDPCGNLKLVVLAVCIAAVTLVLLQLASREE